LSFAEGGKSIFRSLRPKRLFWWLRYGASTAANRARDARDYVRAAELYAEALALDPTANHLRVQRGNMLKDAGRFDEAEAEYRRAAALTPLDADLQLQLGHLYKLLGRRNEAIQRYRYSAALAPDSGEATRELALMGDREALDWRFKASMATGRSDSVLALADQLRGIKAQVERALAELPDLISQTAFPIADYSTLRRVWDVPAPPAGERRPASVIVSIDDLSEVGANRIQAGLLDQSEAQFEALLVGSEPSRLTIARRWAASDPRVTVLEGLSPEAAIGQARHDLIVWPAKNDRLHPHALAWFGWAIAQTPAAAMVCDGEGIGADGERFAPDLGHAVDPETLMQANPYGDALAFDRTRAPQRLAGRPADEQRLALLLDLASDHLVGHIPYPLCARIPGEPVSALSAEAYASVVSDHLGRRGLAAHADVAPATYGARGGARVQWRAQGRRAVIHAIIPTRDNGEDVGPFVRSLRARSEHASDLRITVVDNGSTDAGTLGTLAELQAEGVDVFRCNEPFNWSRLNNLGAARGDSTLLLFANDDMRMLTSHWDETLRGLLARPEVGVVGAKLLYPDSTVQHAGILFGWRGRAIHDGLYESADAEGPGWRWRLRRRVSAVTGAFLAVRRDVFQAVGGFDAQRLAVGYSDLDLALKARELGLAVLWEPAIMLTHFESKSRGLTHLTASTAALDDAELAVMRTRWPAILESDPGVNPAWRDATLPFRLLSPTSREAAVRHLQRSASGDPWAARGTHQF
jgi:GT2 family glycosyltransferase/tetratricopeptide (TPR) repeat protein